MNRWTFLTLTALLLTPLAAPCAADTIATASVRPPSHRGLYAIWYAGMPEVMELPYITGAQVVAQWGELETAEGQYDFSQLEAQMQHLHSQHRPFSGLFICSPVNRRHSTARSDFPAARAPAS